MVFSDSRERPVPGYCEHIDEISDFVKLVNFSRHLTF
jgi:hypothetical protein